MIVIIIYSTKEKIINWYNKVIERPYSLSDEFNSNAFLFRSIIY